MARLFKRAPNFVPLYARRNRAVLSKTPPIVLTANAGAFTVTGITASLEHHYPITAEAGSVAVTGAAATLTYFKGIAAEQGRFNLYTAGNLLVASEDCASAFWSAINALTVTANTRTAPNGTLTADKLTDNSVDDQGYLTQGYGTINDTYYSFSIFVKKDAIPANTRYPVISLAFSGSTPEEYRVYFDTSVSSSFADGGVLIGYAASYDADWWRALVVAKSADVANTTVSARIYPAYGIGLGSSDLDATGFIEVWGASLTEHSTFSNYQPTTFSTNTNNPTYLLQNYLIAAEVGSVAVTGVAATLTYFKGIAANAGSYSVTGQVANLEHHHVIAANAGSYSFTGQAVTFNISLTAGFGRFHVSPTNIIPDPTQLSSWTPLSSPTITEYEAGVLTPDHIYQAIGLEDNNAAGRSGVRQTLTAYSTDYDNSYFTFSCFLKKDAVAKTTRFPRFQFTNPVTVNVTVDTSTGEFDTTGAVTPDVTIQSYDTDWWRVIITFKDIEAVHTGTRFVIIEPAAGVFETGAWVIKTVTTGKIIIYSPQMEYGKSPSDPITFAVRTSLTDLDWPWCAAGQFSFSGQDANLEFNPTVLANAGSYSFTGFAATLTTGGATVLTADAGSYSIAGQVANLEHHHVIAANAGSYSFTGFDATLTEGGVPPLVADAGSYSVTGIAATLSPNFAVIANAGSYSVTGITANLEHHHVIAANAGSYSFTGQVANLEFNQDVLAEKGTYTWTGIAANLLQGYAVIAEAGSYSVVGQDANLEHHHVIAANAGSYSFTGFDATLIYGAGITLVADAGSYSVIGITANLEQGYAVIANAGTYAFTGVAAILDWDQNVVGGAGSFTVTGFDANLERSLFVTAEQGKYYIADGGYPLTNYDRSTNITSSLTFENFGGVRCQPLLKNGNLLPANSIILFVGWHEYDGQTISLSEAKFNNVALGAPDFSGSMEFDSSSESGTAFLNVYILNKGDAAWPDSQAVYDPGPPDNDIPFDATWSRDAGTPGPFGKLLYAIWSHGRTTIESNELDFDVESVATTAHDVSWTGILTSGQEYKDVAGYKNIFYWSDGSASVAGNTPTGAITYFTSVLRDSDDNLTVSRADAKQFKLSDEVNQSFPAFETFNPPSVAQKKFELGWIWKPDRTLLAKNIATLAADAGSVAITGIDATFTVSIPIAADAGSYTVTGIDATLSRTFAGLIADPGAYTWTGIAATLDWDQNVVGGAGVFAITGQTANLEHHRVMPAASTAYSYTGLDAGLDYAPAIIGETGAWNITGIAASLFVTYTLLSDPGAITWEGIDTGIVLNANIPSYTVTGFDTTLLASGDPLVIADAGIYNVVGFDATLIDSANKALVADLGAYTWTGIDAGLFNGPVVVSDRGVYAISGLDANLIYSADQRFPVFATTYNITGADVTLLRDRTMVANATAYVIEVINLFDFGSSGQGSVTISQEGDGDVFVQEIYLAGLVAMHEIVEDEVTIE